MLDADFWLDNAAIFRQRADAVCDAETRDELREFAAVCDIVARKIEEHAAGG
ncbi:MAG TPA: hypothetical protein VNF99_08665 [Stellaceae bacterium]|nr:hypothetical protein [Stellaceae bacterium]